MAEGVFQRRIVIGAALSVGAFALVVIRLADVTVMHRAGGSSFQDHAVMARADLTDRNGTLLARDLPVKDLYARPHVFWDKEQAARDLAAATGADEHRLSTAFTNAKHPYVLVARQLTPDAESRVMHLGLPGLEFEPGAKRYYPDGRSAAQVLGVTDPENNGLSGLELGLEDRLRTEGLDGGAVATSIDMRVQYILTHEVDAARQMFTAHAAGGIVMDVNTGEIIAMASLPDFDPNSRHLTGGDSTRNIMAQDVYELGSVFKIFTFALGLEDRTFRLDEMFKIGTGYKIGKNTIHEAEEDHMPDMLAGRDVLARSSNIGSLQIALRSGGARQKQFLADLGLLAPVQSELPEKARPLYPSNWGMIQTATIGFGHGISVSPLAYVTAAAEVVNGGRRITPTFVRQDGDRRGEQVIKPEISVQMRDLLRYVVTDGTGKKADVPGFDVGGKTGSAQVPGPNGRYLAHALRTSFCAVFPAHNPRYILFVLLDQPHGTKATGGLALAGYTAAPLAGKVISRIAPILGVPNEPPPPVQLARSNS
jgi:cell division protein FtsI (penicillin-binding protein 3)